MILAVMLGAVVASTLVRVNGVQVVVLPRSGEVGRSFVSPGIIRHIQPLPGASALTILAPLIEQQNSPVVRIHADGRPSDPVRIRPVESNARIAAAPDGSFIVGERNQYRVAYYSPDGRWVRTFQRDLRWIGALRSTNGKRYQGGIVQDMAFDGRHAWLVLSRFADPATAEQRRVSRGGHQSAANLSVREGEQRMTHVLSVADVATGTEPAFASVPNRFVKGFLGPARIYTFSEDPRGQITATVWLIELTTTTSRKP